MNVRGLAFTGLVFVWMSPLVLTLSSQTSLETVLHWSYYNFISRIILSDRKSFIARGQYHMRMVTMVLRLQKSHQYEMDDSGPAEWLVLILALSAPPETTFTP